MSPLLIAFPHAGGSAAAYLDLLRWCETVCEVRAIDRPGGGRRRSEEPLHDPYELVLDQTRAVRKIIDLTNRPIYLVGHSLGALIATSTARQLADDGIVITGLFVSGHNAPGQGSCLPVLSRLPDAELVAGVRVLGGSEAHSILNRDLWPLALPVLRRELALAEAWPDPGQVECPIVVIATEDDPATSRRGLSDWAGTTRATTCVHWTGGAHFPVEQLAGRVVSSIILSHLRRQQLGARVIHQPCPLQAARSAVITKPDGDGRREADPVIDC